MRPRFALLAAVIFALAITRSAHSQDVAEAGLNGPVHTVLTEFFSDAIRADDKPTSSSYDIYDARGFIQERFHFPHDGFYEDHVIYTYSGNHIVRLQTIGTDDPSGWDTYTEDLSYDAEGREIEIDRYDRNGAFMSKTTKSYIDTANTHAKITTTTSPGQPDEVVGWASVTDPFTGLASQTTTRDGVTTTDWRDEPVTLGAGTISKRVMLDGSYVVSSTQPDGSRTNDRYDARRHVFSYSKVDAKEHLVESTRLRDSQWLRTTYSRDEKGRPSAQTTYDPDGTISGKITFEYVDDAHGNWIEMREEGMDQHQGLSVPPRWEHLTRRTILYY